MKQFRYYISSCLLLAMLTAILPSAYAAPTVPEIKNVIYMIPDGGAMAPFYLSDAVKQAGGFNEGLFPNATPIQKGEMHLKQYLVGAETTRSANDPVTDSAASGTALSSGYKTNNQSVGIDPGCKPHANILEACQDAGKNTGIVVTYEWTNATPAAFSAHDVSRYNMTTMSEQIVNQNIDVVFGSENGAFTQAEWYTDTYLNERGYEIVRNKTDLANVEPGDKLWLKSPNLWYEVDNRADSVPTLAEMTKAAIVALDDGNEEGFFLMVEGSAVDGGGHANQAQLMVGEYLAFDEAFKIAVDYAKQRTDTIIVVAPDHDTGGLSYDYDDIGQIVSDIQCGNNPSEISWETEGHTARNGGVFMYLPEGVPYPDGIDVTKKEQVALDFYHAYGNFSQAYPADAVNVIDNTELPKYIASLIGIDFEQVSKKLFVDVTDLGTYDEDTEIFTFKSRDISIKRNRSTATVNGQSIDLNGEVALYISGNFYVPERLLKADGEWEFKDSIALYADYNTGILKLSGNVGISDWPVGILIAKPDTDVSDVLNESDIAYMWQTNTNEKGVYTASTVLNKLPGSYTIYTNYARSVEDACVNTFMYQNKIPSVKVTCNGNRVTAMNQISENDTLNILVAGFDLADAYQSRVFVSQYAGNVLKGVNSFPVVGGSIYVGDEFSEEITVGSAVDKIMVMYWSNETHCPLIGAYTIE